MDWYDNISKNTRKIALASMVIIGIWSIDYMLPQSTYVEQIMDVESIATGSKRRSYKYKIITQNQGFTTAHIKPDLVGYRVSYQKTVLLRTVTDFEVLNDEGKSMYKGESISMSNIGFTLAIYGIIVLTSVYVVVLKPKEDLAKFGFAILFFWLISLII